VNARFFRSSGFTFVELLLVVSLLSLLVASLAPSISIRSGGIEAATKKVVSDLRYAQEQAMMTNVNHGIQFNNGGAYVMYRQSSATPVADPLRLTSFSEDLSEFRNVSLQTTLQVEFDSVGRPVLGGGSSVVLSNGAGTRTLRVVANTGLVEVL